MKTNNFLLPHNFQKIGWGIFCISIILLIGCQYAFDALKSFVKNNNYYPTIILYIINMIAMYFVAFSKEKIEDELSQVIRYSSIVFTVLTGFILYTIVLIIFAIDKAFIIPKSSQSYLMVVNPITLFILYVIIFRTRLFIIKKWMQNAE